MVQSPVGSGSTLQLPDIGSVLEEAEAARVSGNLDKAEMLAQRVLALWPGQAHALHMLGLVAFGRGNLDLALSFVRRATRSPSAPALFYSNLAEMCRQKGLLDEGERAGRRAIEMAPAMLGAWNNLGIILQEAGKLEESKSCLETVLQTQPDNAEVHNNLANTCRRMGLLKEAEEHWARALELRPDYPEALSNKVVLLTEQGKHQEAEACGRRALQLNPRLPDTYLNLAGLATVCHNHVAAAEMLGRLLRMNPGHAGALAARAQALRQLDRLDEALAAAKRAVSIDPKRPEGHHAMGVVLQAMGRLDEARAAYEKGGELPTGTREGAAINIGRMLSENGNMVEATQIFRDVLEASPRSATGWYNLAEMVKFEAGDPAIDAMEALLAPPPEGLQSPTQQTLLHFALGKAYLDIGDSDAAFAHLDAGNRMKRETLTYDSAANVKWIHSIAEVFTPELMQRLSGGGAPSPVPVFVLGMPRSGTTLTEQILASHSAIRGAGELKYLHRIASSAGEFPASILGLERLRLAEMGRAYLGHVEPMLEGARHVVDKMPSNFLHVGLIRLILPGAHIIHCRRNPVDTCLSNYSKLFADEQSFTYDQTELGTFYKAYERLMAHWRQLLPPSHFIEVEYEKVVEDTEGQARRLLDFLGLPWEDACLEFYRTKRPVRTASVNQVRKPVYRTSSGRWRKHARNLGPLLDALGIENPVAEPKTGQQGRRRSQAKTAS